VLGISAAWLYVGLPLGMAMSLVHVVRQLVDEGPAELFKSVIETADPPGPEASERR
jgi:TRAP-type C4-dicarboxylate transport system permease small subunit